MEAAAFVEELNSMHALVATLRRKAALAEARHLEDQARLRYFHKLQPLFERLKAAGFGSADEVLDRCSTLEKAYHEAARRIDASEDARAAAERALSRSRAARRQEARETKRKEADAKSASEARTGRLEVEVAAAQRALSRRTSYQERYLRLYSDIGRLWRACEAVEGLVNKDDKEQRPNGDKPEEVIRALEIVLARGAPSRADRLLRQFTVRANLAVRDIEAKRERLRLRPQSPTHSPSTSAIATTPTRTFDGSGGIVDIGVGMGSGGGGGGAATAPQKARAASGTQAPAQTAPVAAAGRNNTKRRPHTAKARSGTKFALSGLSTRGHHTVIGAAPCDAEAGRPRRFDPASVIDALARTADAATDGAARLRDRLVAEKRGRLAAEAALADTKRRLRASQDDVTRLKAVLAGRRGIELRPEHTPPVFAAAPAAKASTDTAATRKKLSFEGVGADRKVHFHREKPRRPRRQRGGAWPKDGSYPGQEHSLAALQSLAASQRR